MTDWQGRRVLVTGAYGFLAGHLIETLLERKAEVIGLVRDCPAESYLQLRGLDARITQVRGDITDLEACRRALNEHEVEVVFHLAAQAIVGMANRSPLSTFESNIRGTYVLLEACRELRADQAPLQAVLCARRDKAHRHPAGRCGIARSTGQWPKPRTPDAGSPHAARSHEPQRPASHRASPFF